MAKKNHVPSKPPRPMTADAIYVNVRARHVLVSMFFCSGHVNAFITRANARKLAKMLTENPSTDD